MHYHVLTAYGANSIIGSNERHEAFLTQDKTHL
jgi:hypothetical protein